MARAMLLSFAEEMRMRRPLERRRIRDHSDPFQLPEHEFIRYFRLTKTAFLQFYQEINVYLSPARRRTAIRNELKVLAVLSFFAQGSYQRSVGSSYLFSMSQPTFSKCLHEVIMVLNKPEILKRHIIFPKSRREREVIMTEFMNKFGFPGVIGCIDGTHVALVRPVDHEETYFNNSVLPTKKTLIKH